MRGKSLERADDRNKNDRLAGIVGGSGRDQKLMQNHFERDHKQKKDLLGKRLDLDQRGVNWHQNSLAVYRDGALRLSKDNISRIEKGDILGGAFKN